MQQITTVNRNINLDFLRFMGISAIILAHMDAPGIVFQVRNYDVPLIVLIAGISYLQYSSKNYLHYGDYLFSRFVRLVIPTWIFLVFYNLVFFLGSDWRPSTDNLIKQYSLIGGSEIGIWILRVLFSMAIIAPLLLKINNHIKNNRLFFAGIIITFIAYEVIFYYSKQFLPENILNISVLIIFFTVPYALIFLLGIRLPSLSKRTIRNLIFLFLAIFFLYLLFLYLQKFKFIPTQQFKNPPQIYYVSYALFVSTSLFYITKFNKIYIDKFNLVLFIGRSTLWIYLWHWFIIKLYDYFKIDLNFLFKFLLIYTITVILVYVQTKIIHLVASNKLLNKNQNKLFVKVFTG